MKRAPVEIHSDKGAREGHAAQQDPTTRGRPGGTVHRAPRVHVDDAGYLYLVDRADDVINRGGEKVYPIEIERVLERHPAARRAVAFGVGDEGLGQRIEAVADARVDPGELVAWARERLGSRAPTAIRIVREPVRNDAGKTSRRRWAAHVG